MKKMKKNKYILLIFFALQSLATVSQTKDTTWNLPSGYLIETVRNTYDTISHEGMKTGLLLNRGMVFTDYLPFQIFININSTRVSVTSDYKGLIFILIFYNNKQNVTKLLIK